MKHKVDLSLIKQNSEDEEIIKEWKVNQHISTKNESSNVESTITLTKKRLILSEKTNDLNYRKFSYRLKDIKAINYSVNQSLKAPLYSIILIVVGILSIFSSIIMALTKSTSSSVIVQGQNIYSQTPTQPTHPIVYWIPFILGIGLLTIGIIFAITKKIAISKLNLIIEADKTETNKIATINSSSSYPSIQTNNIDYHLNLPLTKESVEMCTEIDNLLSTLQ